MFEATVILSSTTPVGPVVSPGAAPSNFLSVPALQPIKSTSVTATTTPMASTSGKWLLDRLVTVKLPSVFCPLVFPAAVERVIAVGPGRWLVSWVRHLFAREPGSRSPHSKTTIVNTRRHLVKRTGCCPEKGPVLRCRVTGNVKGGSDAWQGSTTDSPGLYATRFRPGAKRR